MTLRSLYRSIRSHLLPTPHQRRVARFLGENPQQEIRFAYPLNKNDLVLDVGGYRGDWAAEMVARYRVSAVVFEPVEELAARIDARFAANPDVEVVRAALSDRSGTGHIVACDDGTSLHRSDGPRQAVSLVAVDDWFGQLNRQRVAVMKINIEGAEYDLLERMIQSGLIERVDNLQVQFHDFIASADRRREEIRVGLSRSHEETFCYPFVWENWRRRSG